MEHIKLSVIIPTLNAGDYLEPLVSKLKMQKQKIDQILIVDSGSSDYTLELAVKLQVEIISIEPGTFDHGGTRNLAAGESSGDVLIFMTQDALPSNDETIAKLVKPLKNSKTVVSYARQIAGSRASLSDQYLRLANYPPGSMVKNIESIENMGIRAFQNSNVCSAYRRKEFEALGCFPAPVVCNEDMIFAARAIFAGYNVAYSADAVVYHTHCLTAKQLFRRYFDIAASLDHEPRIKTFGKAEAKGFDFLKSQLIYLKDQNKLNQMPKILMESTAKYLGYKAGSKHKNIPPSLKKYLGSNTRYWNNVVIKSKKKRCRN